jgi:hypothetical protein
LTKRKPISEQQWLSAAEPDTLLSYLEQHRVITRVPGGRRRLALFACACCRLVWHLLENEASRRAVEVSERAAEGQASRQELKDAAEAAGAFYSEREREARSVVTDSASPPERRAALAMNTLAIAAYYATIRRFSVAFTQNTASSSALAVLYLAGEGEAGEAAMRDLRARQAQLVRCIFGNPFRPLPEIDLSWLAWNGGAARKLAASIQAERRFGDLPVLADALEEAGCTSEDILRHCRDGGEHALGCWVIDLLLGKADAAGG